MRRDSLTQWHLRKHPEKISRFDKVVIWSGEHRMYWRSGYCGYTGDILEAGVYDARDALAHTIHCDPEKKIVLIVAPANIQQPLQPDEVLQGVFMYLLCEIRSLYYSVIYSHWPFGPHISGHEFQEQNDGSLKCTTCGKVSK